MTTTTTHQPEGTTMTAPTAAQRHDLLALLTRDRRPLTIAASAVGLSPSDAHDLATDAGYPNMHRVRRVLEELESDPAEVDTAEVKPELSDAGLEADTDTPEPVDTEELPEAALQRVAGEAVEWQQRAQQLEEQLGQATATIGILQADQPVATAERFHTLCRSQLLGLVERAKAIDSQQLTNSAQSILERYDNLVPKLATAEKKHGNAARIAELQAELARLRGKPDTMTVGGSTPATPTHDPKAVRAWASANGLDCPTRGRIPASVLEQYNARPVDQ